MGNMILLVLLLLAYLPTGEALKGSQKARSLLEVSIHGSSRARVSVL